MNKKLELLELSLKAAKWNEEFLPENTLRMQLDKINEESSELSDAINREDLVQQRSELADVFIATSGLAAFNIRYYFLRMLVMIEMLELDSIDISFLIDDVKAKLEVLKKRKYEIVDGVYRHIE